MRTLLCMLLGFFWTAPGESVEASRWLVFYGADAKPERLRPYSLVVFDPDAHPSLEQFEGRSTVSLGYLSLGEVEQFRTHFPAMKAEGIVLNANPNWQESYFVDLRDPRWAKRVIEELIPQVLFQRFDGIFLDTLDNAGYLEDLDPNRFKGMREAAIHLVKAIRLHYPQIKIMLNRSFDILPETVSAIDMLLGESIYASYDFANKSYVRVSEEQYQEQLKAMQVAKSQKPSLGLYSLDYWNPDDPKAIAEIYRVQRANGLEPYVSTIGLNEIISEPR